MIKTDKFSRKEEQRVRSMTTMTRKKKGLLEGDPRIKIA